ncbi:GGDEF domain-containing protein [Deinococcus maricopensis]|uniref:Diguanylate cyclase n=1 Tax=Deinococcus maricopensis (strain DSM 21211 / LMG 22137 / NRRL B-23946 / LB-34) TaxID=709986 RepID=E8U759_DEIML|nr:GGDEF domain-containing protein [Deinococcus maricopensis]ADV66898.1 diguanylate cyclase [Deinococcus maricopensis DSM 21211]
MSPTFLDTLTGLPTRSDFQHDLRTHLHEGACTLILCDLDHLKLINDTFGHRAGDDALRDLGLTLTAHLPAGWHAYRLSGDEFALLTRAPLADVPAWAATLLNALAARPHPLRVSMGAAHAPQHTPPDTLFDDADRRLYSAKRGGRGRAVIDDAPHTPPPRSRGACSNATTHTRTPPRS